MHLVCLGVVRKFLNAFVSGSYLVRLPSRRIADLSEVLESISRFMPHEFARKPRSLKELSRWKATEFRAFLLFTGPVVLSGKIDNNIYDHFLKLHIGMKILLTPELCRRNNSLAKGLLREYVQEADNLYGEDFISYNVHCLVHLADDALRFGHLDRCSAFPFENMLGGLKSLLRKPGSRLSQIVKRLGEQELFELESIKENRPKIDFELKLPHFDGPMPDNQSGKQFKRLFHLGYKFSVSPPDNCVILKDRRVVMIKNIIQKRSGEILMAVLQF